MLKSEIWQSKTTILITRLLMLNSQRHHFKLSSPSTFTSLRLDVVMLKNLEVSGSISALTVDHKDGSRLLAVDSTNHVVLSLRGYPAGLVKICGTSLSLFSLSSSFLLLSLLMMMMMTLLLLLLFLFLLLLLF